MTHPSAQAPFGGSVDSYRAQGSNYYRSSNPADSTVNADTGQLAEGWYDFKIFISCTVNHNVWRVAHRNAANSAVLHRFNVNTLAYRPNVIYIKNWYLDTNERIRIVNDGAITGTVDSAIWWTRRADP